MVYKPCICHLQQRVCHLIVNLHNLDMQAVMLRNHLILTMFGDVLTTSVLSLDLGDGIVDSNSGGNISLLPS